MIDNPLGSSCLAIKNVRFFSTQESILFVSALHKIFNEETEREARKRSGLDHP